MPNSVTRQRVLPAFLAILTSLSQLTCSTESSTGVQPGPPAQLTVLVGDAQSAVVGRELPNAVVVKVVDARGRAVKGQAVNFRVTAGGGSVFAGASVTNAEGLAQERWTLGTTAGVEQTLEARAVDNETGEALVFGTIHATAVADAPAALAVVRQPAPTASSGQALSTQPSIRLLDKYGNPAPTSGIQISGAIAAPTNEHTLTGTTTVSTDNSGLATFTNLAVNGRVGSVALSFTAPDLSPITSSAISLGAGSPARLVLARAPSSPTGSGATLGTQPIVSLADQFGNAVSASGVSITASVLPPYAVVGSTTATTNASGQATFTNLGVSGPAGTVAIEFGAPSLTSVNAPVQVTAGQAASMVAASPTSVTDTASARISDASLPSVVLRDAAGNPVSGVGVAFRIGSEGGAVTSGGAFASVVTVFTDASGSAKLSGWQLPFKTGSGTVTAAALTFQVVFTATITSAHASRVAVTSQPASVESGTAFDVAVQLRDQYNNNSTEAGVAITASAASPYSVTAGGTATTNASGLATLSGLTIAGPTGQLSLRFDSPGLTSASIQLPITGAIGPTGPVATLVAVNGQTSGTVGSSVQVQVRALDASSRGVPGTLVTWSVSSGGASVTPTQSTTDSLGRAIATVRLPDRPDTSVVRAAVAASPSIATSFTLASTPGRACEYRWTNNNQTGERGEPLPLPLRLVAVDSLGNPVPNVMVAPHFRLGLAPPDVPGTVEPVTTDATGLSSSGGRVVLGSYIGTIQAEFTYLQCFTGRSQIGTAGTFTVTASPVTEIVSKGFSPTGATGTTAAITVQALDKHGYYAPDAALTFTVTGPDGAFFNGSTQMVVRTLANGFATVNYVIGASANQTVTVTAPNVTPLVITITRF